MSFCRRKERARFLREKTEDSFRENGDFQPGNHGDNETGKTVVVRCLNLLLESLFGIQLVTT